jgi:hypothetical protein
MVAFTKGPGRWDATCLGKFSLPHLGIGSTPASSERVFSSGNERSQFSATLNDTIKAGYYFKPTDQFEFLVDLMNLNKIRHKVYLTIAYEYIQGAPEDWSSVKVVWLDANACSTSQVKVPKKTKFEVSSKPWKSNFDGKVLGMGGHLHDGGTNLEILWNNKVYCDSKASYGEKGMMESPAMNDKRSLDKTKELHITSMTYCISMKEMKKGDVFQVKGKYDLTQHPAMINNMKPEDIMAISLFYVMVPIKAF